MIITILSAIKFDFSIKLCLLQVIFETSRLATIVNGVLRKTTHDMELNGGFFEWPI
jgi:cytochrome P450